MRNRDGISGRHTKLFHDENDLAVLKYFQQRIVEVGGNGSLLRNGGHKQATVKARMNQFARAFNLGFRVFQKDHEWFVATAQGILPFQDEMVIPLKAENLLGK